MTELSYKDLNIFIHFRIAAFDRKHFARSSGVSEGYLEEGVWFFMVSVEIVIWISLMSHNFFNI